MGTISEEVKQAEGTRQGKVDFKMVTFSLAGKDYGIDIMKVKEISKANKFTYVPNSSPFVRGVFNLRGDIISIIDLRIMFHLPAEKKNEDALEDMIILRLEDYLIGVIVDSIDKVVGISSADIQPPHPIFGDINIKFIKGVVENEGRLYIILDVERILGGSEEIQKKETSIIPQLFEKKPEVAYDSKDEGELSFNFIKETLATFKSFFVSDVNIAWVKSRFDEWKGIRAAKGSDLQLKDPEEAEEYLETFYSPESGVFWSDKMREAVSAVLPDLSGGSISLWNPGCGRGFETYSFTCILRNRYPKARIKVWANDNDLLAISMAPNLLFQRHDIPDFYSPYTVEGKNGLQFSQEIKDSILFEYHDVLNPNPFPEVDLILARDILSFLPVINQQLLLKEFWEKLRPEGVLILGAHEEAPAGEWDVITTSEMKAFKKKM
ncbi:MAG TPA: chemotaxis protein CheW [Spirochaetia bacterium]|nr:chemotaxis protein CheW [Spirochaetia bacterium]